jgi:hypothetical protein
MVTFTKLNEDDKFIEYSYVMESSKDPGIVRFDKETLEFEIIKEDGEWRTNTNYKYCGKIRSELRRYKESGKPYPYKACNIWY